MHEGWDDEGFPEIGYIDVGGDPLGGAGNAAEEEAGLDVVNAEAGQNVGGPTVEEGAAPGEEVPNNEVEEVVVAEGEVQSEQVEVALGEGEETNGQSDAAIGEVEIPNDGVAGLGEQESRAEEESDGLGEHKDLNDDQNHEVVDEDGDSEDSEYVPSGGDTDSADDVHFTDSEEELDFDDSFFGCPSKEAMMRNEAVRRVGGYEGDDGEVNGEAGEDGNKVVFLVHKLEANMANYSHKSEERLKAMHDELSWRPELRYADIEELKQQPREELRLIQEARRQMGVTGEHMRAGSSSAATAQDPPLPPPPPPPSKDDDEEDYVDP
ncbi:hypothetical protein PIB30_059750 [Stylosanthes scabra]|uniref:Uncharacterized protein n=1 Tax=Stylosanthes scabra TaxID=79078 RepID=A0ABU6WK78_9FABA|nr:hypothetical protein [Stylosanthes scabra]